jgi:hypothetical protein
MGWVSYASGCVKAVTQSEGGHHGHDYDVARPSNHGRVHAALLSRQKLDSCAVGDGACLNLDRRALSQSIIRARGQLGIAGEPYSWTTSFISRFERLT